MPGPEFFQTRMGQIFYENTMPEIAKALTRIATAMEKMEKTKERCVICENFKAKKGLQPTCQISDLETM